MTDDDDGRGQMAMDAFMADVLNKMPGNSDMTIAYGVCWLFRQGGPNEPYHEKCLPVHPMGQVLRVRVSHMGSDNVCEGCGEGFKPH